MGWATWAWWIAGGVLGLTGLTLLVWALLRDRARGRRRCPKCWYDMAGVPGLICPECGTGVANERRLYKTRPRKRWAALAVCCLVIAGGLSLTPKARRDGLLSLVPTAVLLRFSPPPGTPRELSRGIWQTPPRRSPVVTELLRRGAPESLTDRQWRWVVENRFDIRLPDQWPVGIPLQISIATPGWMEGIGFRVVALTEEEGADISQDMFGGIKALFIGTSAEERVRKLSFVPELGDPVFIRLGIGVDSGPFGTAVGPAALQGRAQRTGNPLSGGEMLDAAIGEIAIVPSVEHVFDIVRGPEWDARFRDMLEVEVTGLHPGQISQPVIAVSVSRGALTNTLALGFTLSLMRGDQIYATKAIRAHDLRPNTNAPGFGAEMSFGLAAYQSQRFTESPDMWYIRITGRPDLALTDFGKEQAWEGTIDIPLADLIDLDDQ